jgi:hypothetical protein
MPNPVSFLIRDTNEKGAAAKQSPPAILLLHNRELSNQIC